MKRALSLAVGLVLSIAAASTAFAQPRPRPVPAPAAPSWTGFYLGGQIGGAFADRSVGYAVNDLAGSFFVNGGAFVPGFVAFPGQQPLALHGIRMSGITGGLQFGYNWQVNPSWLVGIEADVSGSGLRGTGRGAALLNNAPEVIQALVTEQKVDWWGTARGRLGLLATPDLLLFGTAGLAYGHVQSSHVFGTTSAVNGPFIGITPGFSWSCVTNATCFAGANDRVKVGWTAGAGGEWRFTPRWSLKAEYLYVNLGRERVTATALAIAAPGTQPSSYVATLGSLDFHVVRMGLNYRF